MLAAAAALPIIVTGRARAQQRPVTIVVGSTPGGSTDTMARLMAKLLTVETGRSFVVDNKPGGAGNIASAHVARSAPDGNTLLLASPSFTVNPSLHKNLKFDPVADFTPVSMFARAPNLLVARKDAPYATTAELIAYAKAHPNRINAAVAGQGSSVHLATEELKLRTGITMTAIPYKGTTPALADIIGGSVDLMFVGIVSALPQVQSGALRALGVGSKSRVAKLPAVPSLSDTVDGFESSAWFGLAAPAGLDGKVLAGLDEAVRKCVAQAEFNEKLEFEGAVRVSMSQGEFAQFVREDVARWRDVIQRSGIKVDG